MTLIKSISGIRGTIGGHVGDTLNPLDIVKFTSAYATFIRRSKKSDSNIIVVGRDARISGEMVKNVVCGTLMGMGYDVLNIGMAVLLQQLLDGDQIGIDGGERRVAFKFLLELGEPVVELAIVAATGLHQLADELDTAGAFGIGEARHAVKLLLFLLEGFPESCQLSCYGSHIIHSSGRPVVIIVFVSSSNRKPIKDPVEYLFVTDCPQPSSVKAQAS
jgi:hypothetical protein